MPYKISLYKVLERRKYRSYMTFLWRSIVTRDSNISSKWPRESQADNKLGTIIITNAIVITRRGGRR